MDVDPVNVADYERLADGILAAGPLGYFAGGRWRRADAA
jgi:hypothetical protein